jgi:hypothetical protein
LLFLFVHFGLINTAFYFKWFRDLEWLSSAPYVLWIGVLLATTFLMRVFLAGSRVKLIARPFHWLPVWIAMAILVFAAPVIFENVAFLFVAEFGIGILLSLYYPVLAARLKHPGDNPAGD